MNTIRAHTSHSLATGALPGRIDHFVLPRVGDVTREMNLDLVAKGDTGSATVVFPPVATGEPHAEVVSYTNP